MNLAQLNTLAGLVPLLVFVLLTVTVSVLAYCGRNRDRNRDRDYPRSTFDCDYDHERDLRREHEDSSPARFSWRAWTRRVLALIGLFCIAGAARAQLADNECLKCHGDPTIASSTPAGLAAMVRIPAGQAPAPRDPSSIAKLYTPAEAFQHSAHAGLQCINCHRGIDRLPHDQKLAAINCADCHTEVADKIAKGPHGPAAAAADGKPRPICTDCHGAAHQIEPVRQPRTQHEAMAIVEACSRCHDKASPLGFNPVKTYKENVHGQALIAKGLPVSATCVDCHGNHQMLPMSNPESPIAPLNAPTTCGRCHQGIAEVYFTSIHGQKLLAGVPQAATCTSCHDSHGIQAIGEPFLRSVVQECSKCHLKLGETYLKSYHGKAYTLRYGAVAVCSNCHGSHDILPPSDPRSRVAPQNLIKTCGQCHENVNANFVKYMPHADFLDRKDYPQVFYTWLFMTTMLLSVLCVFIPHGILWFQRTFIERLHNRQGFHGAAERGDRMVLRFRVVHRITHALIIVSFMGLVFTGFPLKYSYAPWAQHLAGMLGGIGVMRIAHRVLAIVTFGYAGIHLGFLVYFFVKHCPRPRWRFIIGPDSMLFSLRDAKDAWAMLRWFLWLGPRPKFDRWTYFEKFDYWGEIWGLFVIGGTGLMLWFPTLFTRWLPGWVLNCAMVVHSVEALLAASVIFLVHFFNTHIRPEKFPIDMVMLTGRMSESEMKEERPAEYERIKASGELEERIVPAVPLKWRIVGAALGMTAFFAGIGLIILALWTEISQFFK